MERLTRGELQKLCGEARSSGKIPKKTKCNGTISELRLILESIPKKEHPIRPYREDHGPYYRILRSLAPYLTYDKLLEVMAYYPDHPLKEELRDPQGKIWSDRVWVELGEPPLNIDGLGIRFYQQWVTQRLAPYGKLLIDPGNKRLYDTGIYVQQAIYFFRFENQHKKKGTIQPAKVRIWALTSRGFEKFTARIFVKNFKDASTELEEALNKEENWEILTDRQIIYIKSDKAEECLALDSRGTLCTFSDDNETLYQEYGLRYVRPFFWSLYGVTYDGEHIFIGPEGAPVVFQRGDASITGAPPVALHESNYKQGTFEFLTFRTEDQGYIYYTNPNLYTAHKGSSNGTEGLLLDKLYVAPKGQVVRGFNENTRSFPRKTIYFGTILGLDGYLYEDRSVGFPSFLAIPPKYVFNREKANYRYSSYSIVPARSAIAW